MAAVEALCVTCLVEETIWLGFLLSVFVGVPLHAGAGAMRMFQRGRSPGLGLPEPRAVLPVLPESKNVTVIPTKTATTWKLLPRAVVTKLRVFTPLLSLTALAFSLLAMGIPRGDSKSHKDLGAIEREAARQLGLSNEQLQAFRKWKGGGGLDEYKKGTT